MKAYQTVLLVIVIVGLNNVVLFNLTRFSITDNRATGHSVTQVEQDVKSLSPQVESNALRSVSTKSQSVSAEPLGQDQSTQLSDNEQDSIHGLDLEPVFDEFISSDKFTQAIDLYQSELAPRNIRISDRISKLSAQDLLSTSLDTSNPAEQRIALASLALRDLSDYSSEDLRTLYLAESAESWIKQRALTQLLNEGDLQALDWAKQTINNSSGGEVINTQLYTATYQRDPDFIKEYFSTFDLNNPDRTKTALSFLATDRDLSKFFYENNLERIIETKNNQVFQYMHSVAYLQLSSRQESRVPELFASKNSSRRVFGINLAPSVKDLSVLRESYSHLTKDYEKLAFLQLLAPRGRKDLEIGYLIQELAQNYDG